MSRLLAFPRRPLCRRAAARPAAAAFNEKVAELHILAITPVDTFVVVLLLLRGGSGFVRLVGGHYDGHIGHVSSLKHL